MGHPLRFCSPNSLVEVTTRTMQGRFLLRPTAELTEIVLGILGRGLDLYPIELHAFIFLSNHYELLLTTPDALTLARFMCFVNGNLAKEAGRLHNWRDKFWSRRYRSIPVVDEESQVGRLRYLLENGCKEGLVGSPRDWPGASSLPALLEGKVLRGMWFNRTAEYIARQHGETPSKYDFSIPYEVSLTPLPCWQGLPVAEQQRRHAELVAEIEAEAKVAQRETGSEPLGAEMVRAQDPHSQPQHSNHSPAPLCHASCRERRLAFLALYAEFVARFRRAAEQLRQGVRQVLFPEHSFPPALPYVAAAPQ